MRRPVDYPTPEEINALPEPLRRYIHHLIARCDPAGDLQHIARLEMQNAQLLAVIEQMKGDWPDLCACGFGLEPGERCRACGVRRDG